jgi:Ion channel
MMDKLRDPHTPHELLVRRLSLLTLITVVNGLVLAYLFYRFERGARGTEIHDYGDALFWTSSQLSSVSSSLRNPLTTPGRILAVGVDVVGVGVVTLLIATIVQHLHFVNPGRADFFHKKRQEKEKAEKEG